MVDGTTIVMPDSEDNQLHYPQHANQAPGVGFPLARLVGIISLSTAAVLAAAMAPNKGKGTGEHGLFRQIKGAFTEGDVMLGDSYYCSYFLIADQQCRGVDVVFEQHGAVIVKPVVASQVKKGCPFSGAEIDLSWPSIAAVAAVSRSFPPASELLLDTSSPAAFGSP